MARGNQPQATVPTPGKAHLYCHALILFNEILQMTLHLF